MYLAAAGVGHLGLVDFDVVDASTSSGKVIQHQRHQPAKLESARDKITEINLRMLIPCTRPASPRRTPVS